MSALETSRVLVDSVDVFKNKTKKKKKKKRYKKNHLSLVLSPLSLSALYHQLNKEKLRKITLYSTNKFAEFPVCVDLGI